MCVIFTVDLGQPADFSPPKWVDNWKKNMRATWGNAKLREIADKHSLYIPAFEGKNAAKKAKATKEDTGTSSKKRPADQAVTEDDTQPAEDNTNEVADADHKSDEVKINIDLACGGTLVPEATKKLRLISKKDRETSR